MQNLIAFLSVIPELLKLMNTVGDLIKKMGVEKTKKYFNDVEQTIDFLKKADTTEKKRESARRILNHIRDLS